MDQLLDIAAYTAATVILTMLGWVLQRYAKGLKLDIDESQRRVLEQVMASAIGHGMHRLQGTTHGLPDIAEQALGYVERSVPQALKHFGIDPRTDAGRDKLRDMILARLHRPAAPQDRPAVPAVIFGAPGSENRS